MSRTLIATVALVALVASLVLGSSATAAPVKVTGKVGPGFTISLTVGGKKVNKLTAGTTYTFVITDRSDEHDFHLMGSGYMKTISGVKFTGTKSVTLKLKKGTHRFRCNPHSDDMRGSFTT